MIGSPVGAPYVYFGPRPAGRVFTRGQLPDAIRGERVESLERAVDAHVKNLRRQGRQRHAILVPEAGIRGARRQLVNKVPVS